MVPRRAARGNNGSAQQNLVRSLFRRVTSQFTPDQSLPAVVVQNRVQRAQDRLSAALVSSGSSEISADLRSRLESLVKGWAARSFEDAFRPIEEFEIECARERDLVEAEASGDPEQVYAVLERRYRRHVIEQYGSIELRGVQVSHRVTLDLDEVYVPLHVVEPMRLKAGEPVPASLLMNPQVDASEALKRAPHHLVIGSPGGGKSTLIAYLATGIADGRFSTQVGWRDRPLPFVLMVRTLQDVDLAPAWFAKRLGIDVRLARKAIEQERVILLVDGLDEATPQIRQALLAALSQLVKDHPMIRAVVTTRRFGMVGETGECLPEFHHWNLADLSQAEVGVFIDKWCLAAEKSVRKDPAEAREQARLAARDLQSRISRSRPIQRIAVNPLLTTILCVVHRFLGRSIPEHRVLLYEKCTEALLYEWDRAKFPASAAVGALDAPQKRILLRGIARKLHERHAAEIAEEEVIQHFAEVLPTLGRSESDAQRIVYDIRDRSGLLVGQRSGFFGFSHLTFQEYFTALDYAGETDRLIEHVDDPWWWEVIPLTAGVPGAEPEKLVRRLLQEHNPTSALLAAQCLETALDLPASVRTEVEGSLERALPVSDSRLAQQLAPTVVGPPLMKKLIEGAPHDKAWALAILTQVDYEPAVPAIAQCATDSRASNIAVEPELPLTLGEWATYVLLIKSRRSDTARRAFLTALPNIRSGVVLRWLRDQAESVQQQQLIAQIDASLKALSAGKRRPKTAESTRKAPPNKRRPARLRA